MRMKRHLSVESLERREVFTGVPGVEGFDIYDAPLNYDATPEQHSFFTVEIGEGRLSAACQMQYASCQGALIIAAKGVISATDRPEWLASMPSSFSEVSGLDAEAYCDIYVDLIFAKATEECSWQD